jgi:hypothetical protein
MQVRSLLSYGFRLNPGRGCLTWVLCIGWFRHGSSEESCVTTSDGLCSNMDVHYSRLMPEDGVDATASS